MGIFARVTFQVNVWKMTHFLAACGKGTFPKSTALVVSTDSISINCVLPVAVNNPDHSGSTRTHKCSIVIAFSSVLLRGVIPGIVISTPPPARSFLPLFLPDSSRSGRGLQTADVTLGDKSQTFTLGTLTNAEVPTISWAPRGSGNQQLCFLFTEHAPFLFRLACDRSSPPTP